MAPVPWINFAHFSLLLTLRLRPLASEGTVPARSDFGQLRVRVYPNSSEEFSLWEWGWEENEHQVITRLNSNLFVLVECEAAQYPTEWIFNDVLVDAAIGGDRNRPSRSEYQQREGKLFKAFIQLSYRSKLKENMEMMCRPVTAARNRDACVLVRLTPVNSSGSDMVRITKEDCSRSFVVDVVLNGDRTTCPIEFLIGQFDKYYYYHCNFTEPDPDRDSGLLHESSVYHPCETAAYCANTMRTARIPGNCVRMVGDITSEENSPTEWAHLLDRGPGLAICTRHNIATLETRLQMGVEYFFGSPHQGPPPEPEHERPPRKLHLSQTGVDMSDLIWMEPVITRIYYTGETMEIRCYVPLYGFAMNPGLWITFSAAGGNDTQKWRNYSFGRIMLTDKYVNVHVETAFISPTKPGTFQLECSAPVWNATEWVNSTLQIQFKNAVPLEFKQAVVHVDFVEGATDAQLRRDAYGDPMPEPGNFSWTWDGARYPGRLSSGVVLNLPPIAAAHHGTTINCTASNLLGQHATKSFHLNVARPVSPWTIVATFVTLVSIVLLVGLVWMYLEYWRYRGIALPTKNDVREFWHGAAAAAELPLPPPERDPQDYVPIQEMTRADDPAPLVIQNLPYNAEWEVPRRKIRIDWKVVLGSGEFSAVYKGAVAGNPVGIKIVNREKPLEYFKALMSELKVHAYIGHHPNVVNLITANASRIRKRELYVCVELCQGSMLTFLRGHAHTEGTGQQIQGRLVRWAREIAAGMEFIASKRVVHGDLAAGNVLLTFDPEPTAKVGDFGLARLTDYIYMPQNNSIPRPWVWMAIECFTEQKFSTKSDVWAFGVTLWEMWSLGLVPYAGMQPGNQFCTELVRGMRLQQPDLTEEFAVIYEIMNCCWANRPRDRPTFTQLERRLQLLGANQVILDSISEGEITNSEPL